MKRRLDDRKIDQATMITMNVKTCLSAGILFFCLFAYDRAYLMSGNGKGNSWCIYL